MAAEARGGYHLPVASGGHQRQMVGSGSGVRQMRVLGARGKWWVEESSGRWLCRAPEASGGHFSQRRLVGCGREWRQKQVVGARGDQKKENNQPEVAVMAAAGGGGGSSQRPIRVPKKEKHDASRGYNQLSCSGALLLVSTAFLVAAG